MCYDEDARPPLPPISGAAADAGAAAITASDGASVAAYAAQAASAGGPGIVVLPDVRGLHPFFEELALRFAEAGVHAVAIDYFSRTAGVERRPDGFDFEPHLQQIRPEAVQADVAAAAAHLRSAEGGASKKVYSVGFCMGGRISYLQAAAGIGLSGVIGFYGQPLGPSPFGFAAPVDQAVGFRCPVLAIWGGADRGIGPEKVSAFEAALTDAGIDYRSIVYPDAPHSFFDRRATEFANESEDAWRQVLAFVGVEAPA
jgi:carboxymethylenebutenolidase